MNIDTSFWHLLLQANDDMARDLEEAEEELERVKVPILLLSYYFVLLCIIYNDYVCSMS